MHDNDPSIRISGLRADFIWLTMAFSIGYTCNKHTEGYFNVYGRQCYFNYSTLVEALYRVQRQTVIVRILTKSIFAALDV